ncbi:DUF1129 domain-containing protein [Lentilactobacillus sp. Marseille-Q4993]|uniref:DUF1129 domain-containing protein n=1 Tax=Lentilactobacillus sp. Marseille-Q4993 TaxID=3039492 RepID=UPI0024BD3C79|nr:DUF1129 domain-containing protein [Lentilactobacillus sp. Marseille-Q4993]
MADENQKRNANVKQDRDRSAKIVHSQFDNIGLTKRNAEYMFKFNKALNGTKLADEKKSAQIEQMVQELLEGQKSGETARNMWGTVDQKVDSIVNPPKSKPGVVTKADYWPNAFYNMILFFVIFNFMYGIMALFSKNAAQATMGITGIVLSSVIAGLGIPLLTMLIAPGVKHKYPLWIRIIMIVGFFAVWMLVFFVAGMIPGIINPVLNPIIYIVLGAIGLAGQFWFKKNYNITGSLF